MSKTRTSPPVADDLRHIADQLAMLAQCEMPATSIKELTKADSFYRDAARTVLARVKQAEAGIVDIVDASTRRDAAAVLGGLRRTLADVATLTPRTAATGYTLDPRASWFSDFETAAKRYVDRLRQIAELAAVDPGHGVTTFRPMLHSELANDIGSEKTIRRWRDGAGVEKRKRQGHRYTASEVRRIVEYGSKQGKGAAKAAAVKILDAEAD